MKLRLAPLIAIDQRSISERSSFKEEQHEFTVVNSHFNLAPSTSVFASDAPEAVAPTDKKKPTVLPSVQRFSLDTGWLYDRRLYIENRSMTNRVRIVLYVSFLAERVPCIMKHLVCMTESTERESQLSLAIIRENVLRETDCYVATISCRLSVKDQSFFKCKYDKNNSWVIWQRDARKQWYTHWFKKKM